MAKFEKKTPPPAAPPPAAEPPAATPPADVAAPDPAATAATAPPAAPPVADGYMVRVNAELRRANLHRRRGGHVFGATPTFVPADAPGLAAILADDRLVCVPLTSDPLQ